MNKKLGLLVAFLLFALLLVACGGTETVTETVEVEVTRIVEVEVPAEGGGAAEAITFAGGGDTLGDVQGRGLLNCGVSGGVVGFSYVEEDGSFTGLDWDYCRAIAAATLGDAEAVEGRRATSSERFPILQSGEIDVLSRNTTWTTSRDTQLGFNFAPTTYYDGQGMMVRGASGITDLAGLDGGTVCVNAGTTTEKNLATVFRELGIEYEAVVFTETDAPRTAYDEGRCDGWTTDKSALVANKSLMTNPDEHVILEDTMSKEPLGPLVRHGDDNWFDIVKWTVFCTILAEDLDVSMDNVDEMLGSDNPEILNLLGEEGDLGQFMGLNNDFCYQVIKQVGNYEDIYNRNLGPDTAAKLPRGVNTQWTEGGLLYSPPFR